MHLVSTGHPETSAAAAAALAAGGNAFDAVVAAGFASAVTEPALTSLGGGGFLLARTAAGEAVLFDFFVDVPGRGRAAAPSAPHFLPVRVSFGSSTQDFHVGHASVAVPGTLAGYLHVHRRLGRLPLGAVVAPAVRLARSGVLLDTVQAYLFELIAPILTLTEAARALHAPTGAVLRAGDRFRNPALAEFLEQLPVTQGLAFYTGEIARATETEMDAGGGLLTAADLAAYEVAERRPLAVDYRGGRLLTNPAPSFGGGLIALSLELLAAADFAAAGRGSTEHLGALAASMVEVDRLRADGCCAPDGAAGAELGRARARVRRWTRGTTHASVADAEGNVASMTTSNGEGSGVVVPGTGVMLNNMMGEDDLHPNGFLADEPGGRVSSMMSPSLLLDSSGVRLVLGSGGSKRIRTAILQVVSAVIDFDARVRDAVEAPRLHWDGATLQVEPGFAAEAVAALGRAWPINQWPARNLYFGGVHAVAPREGAAAADPRRGGAALTVPSSSDP
jgi:gamma-glutamyltranspeptidase / glutathione hydrolase